LRAHTQFPLLRAGLFALATLSIGGCLADSPQTGAREQAVINPPLPGDLSLTLNAKAAVTVGPFAQINGDVAGSGPNGSVLFDVSSSQGFFSQRNVLANTVTVRTGASAGHVFGNDITVDGFVSEQSLGLDPSSLPQLPPPTTITPGTTSVTLKPNQAKQLCPGQFGVISLGAGATLSLNGGVYHMTRLVLADGARLEPSEPVVILITGTFTLANQRIDGPSAEVGVVFQQATLLPWLTVWQNVTVPLRVGGHRMDNRDGAVRDLLRIAGLQGFENKYPYELSGGMQQRVAIVRALVRDPKLLLMDEPFGALDALTREKMNAELQRIWLASRKTVVLITHSIDEAVFLGDRVIVMSARPGRIIRDIPVNLPRPRVAAETFGHPEHVRIAREIRVLLEGGDAP